MQVFQKLNFHTSYITVGPQFLYDFRDDVISNSPVSYVNMSKIILHILYHSKLGITYLKMAQYSRWRTSRE